MGQHFMTKLPRNINHIDFWVDADINLIHTVLSPVSIWIPHDIEVDADYIQNLPPNVYSISCAVGDVWILKLPDTLRVVELYGTKNCRWTIIEKLPSRFKSIKLSGNFTVSETDHKYKHNIREHKYYSL
jgi:hypothetical protein